MILTSIFSKWGAAAAGTLRGCWGAPFSRACGVEHSALSDIEGVIYAQTTADELMVILTAVLAFGYKEGSA